MTFLAEEPFSKRRRAVKVFAVTLMNAKSPAIGEIKTIGDKTASSPMDGDCRQRVGGAVKHAVNEAVRQNDAQNRQTAEKIDGNDPVAIQRSFCCFHIFII